VLREITRRRDDGELSLEFLASMSDEAARAWLDNLPGVGPKTSAAVLSFSLLRKAALPVDSHHHRVAVRLGLIPSSLAVGPSHNVLRAQLPADFSPQELYDNHEVMMLHGQRCCFHRAPACARCPVLDLCPTGHLTLGREVPPGSMASEMWKEPRAGPPRTRSGDRTRRHRNSEPGLFD
jgi:endonuclease-3